MSGKDLSGDTCTCKESEDWRCLNFLPQKEKKNGGGIDVVWNELTNVETNCPGLGMKLL